jgi:hypothetical protein
MKKLFIEAITLKTARGRLLTFGILTSAIFFSRYHWLDHLSIWGDLGIHHAPSIGLTRAYWLFIHGHPVAAWHRNPLIYLVLFIGLPLLIRDALKLLNQHETQQV